MKKGIAVLLALTLVFLLAGCFPVGRMLERAKDRYEEWHRYHGGLVEPEPVEPEPYPEPAVEPETVFWFGAGPFMAYGEERTDDSYDGSMFNDIYNYGPSLSSDEIDGLDIELRRKEVLSGELLDFLGECCIGGEPYVEVRAVTVGGVEEPYRCLYVRLHYPEVYFEDDSYSDIYDLDYDLFLYNCDEVLIENGIDTVIFSMYNEDSWQEDGEMKVITITRQEDGTYLEG